MSRLVLPNKRGARARRSRQPQPLETQFGYKRRDKLADPHLLVGDVITNVLCFDFYEPLFDLLAGLRIAEAGADARLVAFPYDWRRDLVDFAAKRASMLDATLAAGADHISLVAHSMGGLICRLVLEVRRVAVVFGPPSSRLRVDLDPVLEPGHYILTFEGKPVASRRAPLSVCQRLSRASGSGAR